MKQAKMLVIGVQRRHGLSKNGGKPYDMCQTIIARPVEPRKEQLSEVEGLGFVTEEMDTDPAVLEQLKGVVFPVHAQVSVDVVERNSKYYPRIVGVEADKRQASASKS